ncbi:transcriptional antiterminator, BglG family [Pilibacter termitis]|uniref:Transcriptional antiterminator, BglG family n=1 Tax=Pilibacter termitis TaxID=263852 RepID=A0A1T4MLH4_9ENTE|nr:PRD domain-containing protein [Pilibacter termitis]SJZ67731.1 transcriptional antiterminator, BglG family [Pilibacter termitis]
MKVIKRLNNNVVMAQEKKRNFILIGKGIGFNVYPGEMIHPNKIEERYMSSNDLFATEWLSNISETDIQVVKEIIHAGRRILNVQLNENIMFTLLNHLYLKTNMDNSPQDISPPFEWEIRNFYPKEVEVGKEALELIAKHKNIQLPFSEAIFIALHFMNAQIESGEFHDTFEIVELSKQIDSIIQYSFKIDIGRDETNYQRFVTHLKYYLFRVINNKLLDIGNEELYRTVSFRFQEESQCVDKITNLIDEKYGITTSLDEKLYLILHINRLIQVNNQ